MLPRTRSGRFASPPRQTKRALARRPPRTFPRVCARPPIFRFLPSPFTSNPLCHNVLQPKVKGEGKKRKNVGCARTYVYARGWRNVQGGGQAYLHIDTHRKFRKIVGNFREKVGVFFSFCPHCFHTVEGAKVASARDEGNKERTKIASGGCPALRKRHLLGHRAHFSLVNKHHHVRTGEKSAAGLKQGISRSLPFPSRPIGNEGAPLLTAFASLRTKNKESVSELAFDTDSFHLINFCC